MCLILCGSLMSLRPPFYSYSYLCNCWSDKCACQNVSVSLSVEIDQKFPLSNNIDAKFDFANRYASVYFRSVYRPRSMRQRVIDYNRIYCHFDINRCNLDPKGVHRREKNRLRRRGADDDSEVEPPAPNPSAAWQVTVVFTCTFCLFRQWLALSRGHG